MIIIIVSIILLILYFIHKNKNKCILIPGCIYRNIKDKSFIVEIYNITTYYVYYNEVKDHYNRNSVDKEDFIKAFEQISREEISNE